MDTFEKQIAELLASSGATLKRQKKHKVWELPDHRKFVHSATPSDSRFAKRKSLAQLRRTLAAPNQAAIPSEPAMTPASVVKERRRFSSPNWPERGRSDFRMESLSRPGSRPATSLHLADDESVIFGGLRDVLTASMFSPLFWDLNPFGRARVIQKLASRCAKVSVVTGMSLLLDESLTPLMIEAEKTGDEEILAEIRGELLDATDEMRDMGPFPLLLVADPDEGEYPIAVDTFSHMYYFEVGDVALSEAELSEPINLIHIPVAEEGFQVEDVEEAEYDLILLVPGPLAPKHQLIKFPDSPQWSNPALIRPAMKDILSMGDEE